MNLRYLTMIDMRRYTPQQRRLIFRMTKECKPDCIQLGENRILYVYFREEKKGSTFHASIPSPLQCP